MQWRTTGKILNHSELYELSKVTLALRLIRSMYLFTSLVDVYQSEEYFTFTTAASIMVGKTAQCLGETHDHHYKGLILNFN